MSKKPTGKQKHVEGVDNAARMLEVQRKGKLVTEKFYPNLVNATVSVEEAKMLIQAMSTCIMEAVMETMKERKMSEISAKLLKRLCPDGAREKEVKRLIDTLSDETLFVGREVVEGMTSAIQQMITDEMQGRTLNSFKPDWNKMLSK